MINLTIILFLKFKTTLVDMSETIATSETAQTEETFCWWWETDCVEVEDTAEGTAEGTGTTEVTDESVFDLFGGDDEADNNEATATTAVSDDSIFDLFGGSD